MATLKQVRTISHVKINARRGVSVPSHAIVSSKGFQENFDSVKRIFKKSIQLNKIQNKTK